MKLYNGIEIPDIAFGPGIFSGYVQGRHLSKVLRWNLPMRLIRKIVTYPSLTLDYSRSIASAIKLGFRLIDYAVAYGDQRFISNAIERSGIDRAKLFLTGRFSNVAQYAGEAALREEVHKILKGYRTEQLDLLMFHWPVSGCYEKTWEVVCDLYERGIARSIGVANCHSHHIERLQAVGLKPMLNQVEIHPLFTQKALVQFCQNNDIVVEGYTPIARYDDRLMRLPRLKKIATDHQKSVVQVVLRWHIQNGVIPVIRSFNPARQKEDFDIFDFSLTDEEMKTIDGFNINSRLRYDPDNCDFTIL